MGDINTGDIGSTSSIGGYTSVLDFDFGIQNIAGDNAHYYNTEENEDTVDRSQHHSGLFTAFGDTKENSYKEFNNGKSDCNSVENKRKTPSEYLATDLRTTGNKTYDHEMSKDTCDSVTKTNKILNAAQSLPFLKKNSYFATSDINCSRSLFTLTELKLDKRLPNSAMKCSYNHTVPHTLEHEKKFRSFPVSGSSPAFFPLMEETSEREHGWESLVYGTLYVFGFNRTVPEYLAGKINTKYVFRKRTKANGLKEAFSYVQSNDEPICISPARHVISYPLPANHSVVVAFRHDALTDMFQIGRHEKHPVDFQIDDVNPSEKARHGVSRYACRILVRRDGNHEARVYAAAYDSSQAIFLGESGIPFSYQGKMDGFTTNGVLIMQPEGDCPGVWREVSVSGYIYPLRSPNKQVTKRPRLLEEFNILQDGTLIDLCGVTLIWRTPEGLKKLPNAEYLSRLQSTIHRSVPECRLLSQASILLAPGATKKAYVYLSCGHVIGLKLSKPHKSTGKGWSCPVCRVVGPITILKVGAEPGFYIDREFPMYAFKPCGHVASQKTVEYWSSVEIPNHRDINSSFCPFCNTKLNFITKYVKLTLPVP